MKSEIASKHPLSRLAEEHPADPGRTESRSNRARCARMFRCSTASRPSATRRRTSSYSWRRWPRPARKRWARWETDTPISAMSEKSKLLYTYFKQNFAQVTNPPIDPIREELVMSLVSFIGPRPNIFDPPPGGILATQASRGSSADPSNGDLEKIRSIGHTEDRFDTKTIDITYSAVEGDAGLRGWRSSVCASGPRPRFAGGYNIIILSDRQRGSDRIAIPVLLATAAVHHHLIRKGLRTSVGLVVESGEPREVHHFCCLAGFGAEAINPLPRLRYASRHAPAQGIPAGSRSPRSGPSATSSRSARAFSR